MIWILDTSVLSAVRRPSRAPQVVAWLRGKPEEALFLSAVTIGEIAHGIVRQECRDPDIAADLQASLGRTVLVFTDRILAFGAKEARIWGRLNREIGHPDADLLIAATALRHDATVVTGSVDDFAPTGVRIENPF